MPSSQTRLQVLSSLIAETPAYLGLVLIHPADGPAALRILWSADAVARAGLVPPPDRKSLIPNHHLLQQLAAAIRAGHIPVCLLSLPDPDCGLSVQCNTAFPWSLPPPWTPARIHTAVHERIARLRRPPAPSPEESS